VSLPVVKGHGTQNDFVLIPDPLGRFELDAPLAAALCDRRAGIGGDGAIRVVRSADLADGAALAGEATWFMDYRNADGSLAEMCGNGIRVFVAYLLHAGLARLEDGGELAVGTRGGVRRVRRDGPLLAVDLGPWQVEGSEGPTQVTVALPGGPALPALTVDVGNPHTVIALPDPADLAAADLHVAPVVDPVPAGGTNVELIVPRPPLEDGSAHLLMRVHERGSGETRSCGTGAAAAVLAARAWAGAGAPDRWWVDVPGGRLRVVTPPGTVLSGPAVELAGGAVLVAEGALDRAWLDALRLAQPA
jgi:diaminopimelate epimerase